MRAKGGREILALRSRSAEGSQDERELSRTHAARTQLRASHDRGLLEPAHAPSSGALPPVTVPESRAALPRTRGPTLAAEPHTSRRRLLGRDGECAALDRLLAGALAGRSGVAVLRGEAGVGKSALLDYVSDRAEGWRDARAVGVESEMELAYSGLHQLCAPMLDHLDRLPVPQRDALATVFGQSTGPAPDRFLVGLATLTLLAEIAEEQPLVCMIDDAQWLDSSSAQILGFVARRLLAERVALVCAARTATGDDVLAGLPELFIEGLGGSDARALLLDSVRGPLDAAVCEQIVAESYGNPLALLELPRTWNAADLAGGFGLPGSRPVVTKIEQSYARRLAELPSDTQLLVLAAAADPLGDPILLHRAAETLGLDMAAADDAVDARLLTVRGRVEFAHPLVRSVAYRSAVAADRHRVHWALADATDAELDPDRRAWHRAQATPGPSEEVAAELERSAGRAQDRGGLAAAATFLRRSVALTADPALRGDRALAAALATLHAGSLESAVALLGTANASALDEFQRARADLLRGEIALVSSAGRDAAGLLLRAAKRFEPLDVTLARETYLDAWGAAMFAGPLARCGDLRDVSRYAKAAPRPRGPAASSDLLLDGLATLIVNGRAAAAPTLRRAVEAFREEGISAQKGLQWAVLASTASVTLWDFDSWEAIITVQADRARATGSYAPLSIALHGLGLVVTWAGNLEDAATRIAEAAAVTEATGTRIAPYGAVLLAAFRGREAEAAAVIETTIELANTGGEGLGIQFSRYASAVLYNGLGRYDDALAAARLASEDTPQLFIAAWALPELIEAAIRTGDAELAGRALEQLTEAANASDSDWGRGVEARSRALLSEGERAEGLHEEAIERLGRTRLRPELARAHLLYGERLRREGRRLDAREQLRTAYEAFAAIGMEAFAERARGELLATGDKVRKRSEDTRDQLTPQEEQIARLARAGLSNPEIGAQLFISPRTVEWHLRKVFTKLAIHSRRELANTLPSSATQSVPAGARA
jgi:DNA-binding CsgD family transcriptional regulator